MERYARQMILQGFGTEGQERLSRARVLILGAGGLGSVCAQYLVRAGIGRLTLIDKGRVDLPDLNRQLLYCTGDVGASKVVVASRLLRSINPEVEVLGIEAEIDPKRLPKLISQADVVVDGLDSFPTRMMANEACCKEGKTFVHGGVLGFRGIAAVAVPGKGPCLQCIYHGHDLTPVGTPLPVLGPIPGIIGCVQAIETINILTGTGPSLLGRLLLFNGKSMNFSYREVDRRADCAVCGEIHTNPEP
ncbi:MAG: HesA/MoeB/ThiF family protein [Pseudomonadota bacterium]